MTELIILAASSLVIGTLLGFTVCYITKSSDIASLRSINLQLHARYVEAKDQRDTAKAEVASLKSFQRTVQPKPNLTIVYGKDETPFRFK